MRRRAPLALALALAVGLAAGVSPLASTSPDGLERIAEDHGFAAQARAHSLAEDAPAPDYALPGISDPRLATGAAGFAGTLAVFVLAWGAGRLAARPQRPA